MENVCQWFVYDSIKANPDKFQFIIPGNTGSHTLQIDNKTIKPASSVAQLIQNSTLKNILKTL